MTDWISAYGDILESLPRAAKQARLTMAGFSACIDVVHHLDKAGLALLSRADGQAARLCGPVVDRIRAGRGGEIKVDWPAGSDWLTRLIPGTQAVGGTAAQGANALALLGAPALLALSDRSADQLGVLHPNVHIGVGGGDQAPISAVVGTGESGKPAIHIIEFAAGTPTPDGGTLPRSSRIIVRFADVHLERDDAFVSAANRAIADERAGAGVISGFNAVPANVFEDSLDWAAGVAGQWHTSGLSTVHLELAEYPTVDGPQRTLDAIGPHVTSVGLSESELIRLAGTGSPAMLAADLAEAYGLRRVVVHADQWALVVTREDPEREREALLTGALLASCRADAGELVVPTRLPAGEITADIPPVASSPGLTTVVVPVLWQRRPAGTVGLGDTFLAGSLLVLGRD